jgi:hypothetical protein
VQIWQLIDARDLDDLTADAMEKTSLFMHTILVRTLRESSFGVYGQGFFDGKCYQSDGCASRIRKCYSEFHGFRS